MRILVVTPYVPSLIRVRPFNFIRQLSKRHDVVLVCLLQGEKEEEAVAQVSEYCEKVYAFPLTRARSLANCCRRLLSRTPLQAAYASQPAARGLVSKLAESGRFDVLHVEHIRGAYLAWDVRSVPRIYDAVDCMTRLLKMGLAESLGAFRRALGYEELLKMRAYEPQMVTAFDKVIITSEHDKRAMQCLIRRFGKVDIDKASRIAVVGNGVDGDYFHPTASEVAPGSIVFSGKMSYFANASAAIRFYKEVFPTIRRERPDAVFKIVGSDPPEAVRRLADDPAVEVTGYLSDIRPQLGSAAIVVCPLTIGVGIQNKVLEAMAMAKPVVATPLACSGIPDALAGRDLIRAAGPSHTAKAILHLLDYPQYGRELGENARRLVTERYSWEAAARKLEEVYAQTVETGVRRDLIAA
jgi:sugar transferase (PEP-CTERM/EpsH1 system associated)